MAYTKRLPANKDMVWLSKLVTSYPASRRQVLRMARMWNFPQEVVAFLRQFSADEEFMSRTDLVTRCEDLALLIRQQWESPQETLQNTRGQA